MTQRPAHHSREGGARAKKPSQSEEREGVEVVCRLSQYDFSDPCVVAIDDTVRCSAPPGLVQRNGGGLTTPDHFFKFGYVFDDSETQKHVFERCSLDLIEQLITARNALLFIYRNPSPDEAASLPRTLDVIFNSIDNITPSCTFFRMGRNAFGVRDAEEAANLRRETPLLNSSDVEEGPVESAKVPGFDHNYACAVFVSYVEVYNDVWYDLLDELPDGSFPPLELLEDSQGLPYLEGVCEVEVANRSEAMRRIETGDARRRRSATLLNADSSRSHSVFTVKLVMAPCQQDSVLPVVDAGQILFGQLSLVDLAGSERQKRTQNTGEKLAKASSINNSLVVLRRCIQQLRTNQRSRRADPVPFREVKLTHLFKMFFEGGGKIRMIVCVNPRPTDYAENINVLGFGEESEKLPMARGTGIDSDEQTGTDSDDQEAAGDDEGANQRQAAFVSTLISLEKTITRANSYDSESLERALAQLQQGPHSVRIKKLVTEIHGLVDFLAPLIGSPSMPERLRVEPEGEPSSSSGLRTLSEHSYPGCRAIAAPDVTPSSEAIGSPTALNIQISTNSIADGEDGGVQTGPSSSIVEHEKARETMQTQLRELLTQMKMELKDTRAKLAKSEKKNMKLIDFLSALQPWLQKNLTDVISLQMTATTTMSSTVSRSNEREVGKAQHSQVLFNQKPQRRSKSAPRILMHNPAHTAPTRDVLQPQLPRRYRERTRLEAADLEGCTEYVLTHQKIKENGDIATTFYKGECKNTATGGSAVSFKDVERVVHEPPSREPSTLV